MERIIELPVIVHLVDDPTGQYTTARNVNEIAGIFEEVNRIWLPAQIRFVPNNIQRATIDQNQVIQLLDLNGNENPVENTNLINTYYVNNLNIIDPRTNGFSRPELRRTFIKDDPTVHDFRCTAHEFGHVLGLGHVPQTERLMAEGVNGENLLELEIRSARHMARL